MTIRMRSKLTPTCHCMWAAILKDSSAYGTSIRWQIRVSTSGSWTKIHHRRMPTRRKQLRAGWHSRIMETSLQFWIREVICSWWISTCRRVASMNHCSAHFISSGTQTLMLSWVTSNSSTLTRSSQQWAAGTKCSISTTLCFHHDSALSKQTRRDMAATCSRSAQIPNVSFASTRSPAWLQSMTSGSRINSFRRLSSRLHSFNSATSSSSTKKR